MKERTKPIGIGMTAILAVLLLIGSISVAGASGDDYLAENFYVDEDTAWIHADVYLTKWMVDETPGLEDWDGAKVQKGAVTVYDIHGTKLFYEFTVTKDGKAIGEIEIAASKVLGSSLRRVILSPPMDRETAAQKAIEVAEIEYPDYKIQSTKSVCYSYPKEGVMVTLAKPEAKEEQTVIVDPYTSSMIPLKEPEMEGESGVWSIYDKLSAEERAERVEKWSNAAKFVADYSVNGNSAKEDEGDRGSKTLSVSKHAQLLPWYCAPATGQMISDYYDYDHSQLHVAGCMGTTTSGTTMQGQLDYYQDDINKPNSDDDYNPTWSEAVNEINADRPLKSGVEGHARCCRGWKDTGGNYLYINDPWPMLIGDIYWEDWDDILHTNYIYVK